MRRTLPSRIIAAWDAFPHMGTGFGSVSVTKPDSSNIVDAGVERTTLSNGVTVVTHDQGCVAATVGLFADAGAKYDSPSTPGLAHVHRQALFAGNMHNSMFQIDRAFRAIGGSYGTSEVNKRWIGAWGSANRAHFRTVLDELAPGFAVPRYAESDIERFRDHMDNQLEELRWNFPRTYAVDQLERVAFYKEPLGNPRMVPPEGNSMCTSNAVIEKYASFMAPSRIVLVGVNVGMQELVAAYENQAFEHSATAPHHARAQTTPQIDGVADEKAQFYAAKTQFEYENRADAMKTKPDMEQEGIAAIGWLTHGADGTVQEYAAGLVYAEMLACSVGEGLYNPAAERTANGIASFYRPYSTAGLVGFTVRAAPENLSGLVQTAAKSLPTDLANVLAPAKVRAASRFFADRVENATDYAAFLASSKFSAEEVLQAIDQVTIGAAAQANDLARSKKPSLFATGDVLRLPTAEKLAL
eukprot:CAMPEP_0174850388 /NCGR_PEP_ID=MMETSP1114-20130205/19199_1 /TAXON_ID=312471 /ORGANISM="Neobodo designis, Strain CCAP 1951/1" /LENGTH=469 /DNA_ID=CAMNT_0016084847 /DNA_START=35 /DNA_END=1444 /DNA_ORIENTATION=+